MADFVYNANARKNQSPECKSMEKMTKNENARWLLLFTMLMLEKIKVQSAKAW